MTSKQLASVEVPGSARPDLGLGGIRRCALECGPELTIEGKATVYEVFYDSVRKFPHKPCLGYRPRVGGSDAEPEFGPYVWYSYQEAYERALNFGSGLEHLGLVPANSDGMRCLAFYAKNRPEWVIGDVACYSKNFIPTPMYDTLGVDSVEYVVRQTEVKTVVCTTAELAVLEQVAAKGLLDAVVLMDGPFLTEAELSQAKQAGEAAGLRVLSMGEVEDAGKANPTPLDLPRGADVAFFCYTSGTTGDPKGALITHQGIISCLSGLRNFGLTMYETDVHLSYLPLPHVFERGMLYSVLYGGGCVGFYQGDTQKILDDIVALRPTIFPSVPRLLNKLYDKLQAGVEEAGGVKAWLFNKALQAKLANLRAGSGTLSHPVWDRLVFNGIKAKTGFDRIRMMMTGSAPIAGPVLDFLRAVFGCPVCEGYGQTESSLLVSFTLPDDLTTGHVGVPAPCNEIRLVAVDEMGYNPTDTEHSDGSKCLGRGEICFRGTNVFKEYYRMPEKTAETIDPATGWVATGDIGLFTPDGKLRIIDRKKNIFKLAQGEYVAAEKIENVLLGLPSIAQLFIYGDSLQNCLVAIVVPDAEYLEARGMDMSDPATKASIFQEMQTKARAADLKGFEIPKEIALCPNEFNMLTPRDGIDTVLTPTFKLVRNKAKDYFQAEIEAMYAAINSKAKL